MRRRLANGGRARARLGLTAGLLAAAALGACTKHDSLILLELRLSGPLGAPVVAVRLSARGWPTRTVPGSVGLEGFRVGYYGPGDGEAVTVTAQALDDKGCVLGTGSAGVAALEAGATSAETRLFIRALPSNGCFHDAGADAAGTNDASTDAAGTDAAGTDAAGTDAADTDADLDAPTD